MTWGRLGKWAARSRKAVRLAWANNPKEFAAAGMAMVVCLLLVVVVQGMLLKSAGWSVNFGSMPDWLAGIGTVGTLWVALRVWRHDVRNRRADEAERAESAKRAQAELVAAWIVTRTSTVVVVALSNASKGLVYDVQLQTTAKPTTLQAAVSPAAMIAFGQRNMARGQLAVLPPGDGLVSLTFSVPRDMDVATVELWFRDQAGRIWFRDERGRLSLRAERRFSLLDPFSDLFMGPAVRSILSRNPFHVEPQVLTLARNS